jgi:hypothetical protein
MSQKERMSAAMRTYADALEFIPGPTGDLIYLDAKTRLGIAWHLARAVGEDAVIKRRPIPARPGQMAGMIQWVPIDAPDDLPDETSAFGPVPDARDLHDALPWHVRTHIQGAFK